MAEPERAASRVSAHKHRCPGHAELLLAVDAELGTVDAEACDVALDALAWRLMPADASPRADLDKLARLVAAVPEVAGGRVTAVARPGVSGAARPRRPPVDRDDAADGPDGGGDADRDAGGGSSARAGGRAGRPGAGHSPAGRSCAGVPDSWPPQAVVRRRARSAPLRVSATGTLRLSDALGGVPAHPLIVACALAEAASRAGVHAGLVGGGAVLLVAHRHLREPLVIDPGHPETGVVDAQAAARGEELRWRCAHQTSCTVLDAIADDAQRRGDLARAIRAAELRLDLPFDDEALARRRDEVARVRARLN